MGLLIGSASVVQFQVIGELPEMNTLGFIHDKVREYSFKDIDDTYDEYSVGWVSITDMFDTKFLYSSAISGDFVTISLRVDERKVPGAVLKKFIAKEERRIMDEKQIPRLSKGMKVEIKERVKVELIRKAKPTPTVIDLVWEISRGKALVFSTNKKAHSIIEEYFKHTFGLNIRQNIPYLIAESFLPTSDHDILKNLSECSFITIGGDANGLS